MTPRTAVEEALCRRGVTVAFSDTDSLEDLGMDSLDVWEAIMDVEAAIDIEVSDDQVETIKTVGEFIALAERLNGVVA